jgi:hypothetical protein
MINSPNCKNCTRRSCQNNFSSKDKERDAPIFDIISERLNIHEERHGSIACTVNITADTSGMHSPKSLSDKNCFGIT